MDFNEQKRYMESQSVESGMSANNGGNGRVKVVLGPDELPSSWFNILPDLLGGLPPPVNPATREPIGPEALAPIFPKEIIRQEVSSNRFEPIPEELREAYLRLGRPTPLYRATRLEKALKTMARI